MIDIHSHIVFDVDDGPKTREDTRALLTESYRQGVRTIISTSHRRKGMFETPEEKISENFQEVKKIAAEVAPDLTIHYGAEIYFTNDVLKKLEERLPRVLQRRILPSLNLAWERPIKKSTQPWIACFISVLHRWWPILNATIVWRKMRSACKR